MIKNKDDDLKTEKEKIEERREEVLKSGRKFKYPLQYAKHKTVLYTVIIAVFAFLVITGAGYVALYKSQSTSDILYRVTTLLPLPVANIDGEPVLYSDYLLIYRSTITPVEQQLGNDTDSETMKAHYKRSALTDAENYAYSLKLAREKNLYVTEEDINAAITNLRKVGGVERSEASYAKVLQDNFGLTMDEYRRMIYLKLIKTKVAEAVDQSALQIAEEVNIRLKDPEVNMSDIAAELGEKVLYEETGGLVDQLNVDGGRATIAMQLEPGQISERFLSSSGDGYYFVKLIEKTENSVNYTSIKIPLNAFNEDLKQLRSSGAVREYIDLAEDTDS